MYIPIMVIYVPITVMRIFLLFKKVFQLKSDDNTPTYEALIKNIRWRTASRVKCSQYVIKYTS